MKKMLLLTGILLWGISLSAQQPDGTYKSGNDSIAFSNDKVIFCVSGFGGLSTADVGEGAYEFSGDYLLVHTSEYRGNKTSFQPLDGSRKDTCIVKTVSLGNYPMQGILVESRNKPGKLIHGKVTDNEGKIFFTPCDKIIAINATSLGYDPIFFDYIPGKDYLIRLSENNVIENKTVVFRIHTVDDETISLLMLADNFNTGKERVKELKKLDKKALRSNRLDKRLKKVYVPYIRRN